MTAEPERPARNIVPASDRSTGPERIGFFDVPRLMVGGFIRHRFLIWQLSKRDVVGRYRGSALGMLWSLFTPIMMLAVYTYVFAIVFKVRWPERMEAGELAFAAVLFSGLIVHGLFAECFNRAPQLITGHPNYVKKVIFPLEILPWIAMASAVFHTAISYCVLFAFELATEGAIPATALLLPVILLPLILLTLGITWLLASLGVFLRDIGQVTGVLTTVLLFVSPIFFPVEQMPPFVQQVIYLNPLSLIVEQSREVILWGRMPDWLALGKYTLVAAAIAWIGLFWFARTRKGFADVL